MLAGSGVTGQVFRLPYWIGIIFLTIVLIMLFYKGIHHTLMINFVLIPILIIALVYVLILFSIDEQIPFLPLWTNQSNWLASFSIYSIKYYTTHCGARGNRSTNRIKRRDLACKFRKCPYIR